MGRDVRYGAVGVVLGLTAAGPVAAQPVTGLYIGGAAGLDLLAPATTEREPWSRQVRVVTNPGPIGLAALGWGFGNGLRVELEGSYRNNGVRAYKYSYPELPGLYRPNPSGSLAGAAIMANLAFDIDLSRHGLALRPYLGAGLGYGLMYGRNAVATRQSSSPTCIPSGTSYYPGVKLSPAAGAGLPISSWAAWRGRSLIFVALN